MNKDKDNNGEKKAYSYIKKGSFDGDDLQVIKSTLSKYLFMIIFWGIIGLMLCILGIYTLRLGLLGESNWFFSALGLESKLERSSPGGLLIIGGVIIIIITILKGAKIEIRSKERS